MRPPVDDRGFARQAGLRPDTPVEGQEQSVSVSITEGDVLAGKYQVEQVLGRGGMGVVVAATHLALHQKVAIKVLLDGANDEVIHRFVREARNAVRLKSEHVAKVYDVGQLDGEPADAHHQPVGDQRQATTDEENDRSLGRGVPADHLVLEAQHQ